MNEEVRILGIDFGEARIGIAISDPLGITAQPVKTLINKGKKQNVVAVAEIITKNSVALVLIGLPLLHDGNEGTIAKSVKKFARSLEATIDPVPIKFVDERFTTKQAELVLLEANTSRARRKEVIDTRAAQLILQGYLDRKNQ